MNIADPYQEFSKIFDRVASAQKYVKWQQWINDVWTKHGLSPKSLLDLACGTGNNAIRFSHQGLKVFGVDSSQGMLNEARAKKSNVQFSYGNFLNFLLPQTVDAVICLDFSTNYILRFDEFAEFINRVYASLNSGGIFIFDFKPVNSFVKKEKHLKENDFIFDWVCNTHFTPFVVIDMNIALANGRTFQERHIERGYNVQEIKQVVSATKFSLLEVYDDCILKTPNDNSELIQLVLKK